MSAEPEQVDATRRTRLANERTYLAWWRSGLTAFAVSIGFGKVVPGVADVESWPYAVAGAAFAALGTVFIAYGSYRRGAVERALDRGEFAAPDARLVAVLTLVGVALGVLTLVLVVTST